MMHRHCNLLSIRHQVFATFAMSCAAMYLLACGGDRVLSQDQGSSYVDPAPPKVNKIDDAEPLPAAKHPTMKRYKPAKPLPEGAVTHEWASFLGPTFNAVSTETKLLKQWPKDGPKKIWELPKGTGYASPAIKGQYLVFIHRMGDEEIVECLNPESGLLYWTFKYPTQYVDRYGYNNGPRASPVIDGDRVYAYGAEGVLHCVHLTTGKVIWKRDLQSEFKPVSTFFGVGTTPLIEDDLLIINVGAPHYKSGASVVALNKTNGKVVWYSGNQWGPSYASPIPATVHGKRCIFVLTGGESRPPSGGLLMIDPKTGKILTRFPWRSRSYESVNAASPVIVGNQVFISATYQAGGVLLNIKKDFTHQVAWTAEGFDTHWNTAVHKDGYLYGFAGRNEPDANLVCYELKTGKEMWRKKPEFVENVVTRSGTQREMTLSTFRGSLLWADGHFLCLGELGHLLWLDLTPQGYKEISRAWLFDARQSWALPVLRRGLLFVTQNEEGVFSRKPMRLFCYDLRAESK